MFNRVKNATAVEEEGKNDILELNSQRKLRSSGVSGKISAQTAQSPNDDKTVIGERVVIEGKIRGSGNLIVEGAVKGDVELDGKIFTVGPRGRMEGEIIVKDAVIRGLMQGKIIAGGTVHIARNAEFRGDIKAKSISIDDGAFFKGKIEMDREPGDRAETADRLKSKKEGRQNTAAAVMAPEPVA